MDVRGFILTIVACLSVPGWATEGFFDSNGVKIHYVTEGEGVPVILIHGWMSDVTTWGPKLSPLEGFQLVALDCRGHCKSDKPHDPKRYGAEMAMDIVRLMDHLKLKKAHLVGYSMGTFIAGKVAASHPDRVLSLTYGGQAPLLIGESGSKEIDAFVKAVDEGKGLGPYIVEVSPPDRKPSLDAANAIAKMLYRDKDVVAWAAAGKSFKGLEVRLEDLRRCAVPTLFIYGSKEADNTKKRVAALRSGLVASEEKVIDGGDHVTTLAKPAFGKGLIEFLLAHKG